MFLTLQLAYIKGNAQFFTIYARFWSINEIGR